MAKTIFFGTSEFGLPALEVLKRDYDLLSVVTQPDRPVGRKKILSAPPVKKWAQHNGINVLQPEKIIQITDELKHASPEFIVVASYGQIIPLSVLNIPAKGCVNLHSSLLPKYRGASPIQAALLNEDTETGVTLMLMDEKMDHGPIISQTRVPISNTDDYVSLHDKLSRAGAELLSKTLPEWLEGKLEPKPQNHEAATYVKLLTRNDARLDWTKPAKQLLAKIRALNPEPGTWTTLDKKSVKIMKAEEIKNSHIELPGKIYSEGNDCLVKCADYSLKLLQVQLEGGKPISGRDFLNGLKKFETKVFI